MKYVFFSGLMISLFSFILPGELPIGATMPLANNQLMDVSGKQITLKGAKQKNGLLVIFSCNTCPFVVKNQQRTKAISSFALKNEIGVILLNSNEAQRTGDDSYDAMKQYATSQNYGWYYVVDEKNMLADAFGATRTPEAFLFDKEGKLVYHGAIDDNPEEDEVKRKHLQEALTEMLQNKPISVSTTRSVGCGIKRVK